MTLGSPFSVSHSESCSQLLGCGAQQRLKNQPQEGRAILWACSVCILSCLQQNLAAKKVEVDWDRIPVSHWQGLSELCLVRSARPREETVFSCCSSCLTSAYSHHLGTGLGSGASPNYYWQIISIPLSYLSTFVHCLLQVWMKLGE